MVTIASCKGEHKGGNEEGIIEFDTEAMDKNHPLYGFAPSEATLKFKKEKFIIEMSAMGMFNTSIIGNCKTKTMTQAVRFLNINQACTENEKDIVASNNDYPIKIEETEETKDILGFKCYKARVTKTNEPSVSFDVWYTKDLGMEDCNALTPYAQLKGIMLDYRIKKMGIEMRFKATSYSNTEIPNKVFEIPSDAKIISKDEMAEFFNSL